jgi:hypothetical protein
MYTVDQLPPVVPLGRQGEHGVRTLTFNLSAWAALYPGLLCSLTLQSPEGDAPFPATGVAQEGATLRWLVGREATADPGMGNLVVRGYAGDAEVRSAQARTLVEPGQTAAGEAPDAVADWIGEAARLKAQVEAQSLAVAGAEAARGVFEAWDAQKQYVLGNKAAYEGRSYVWTQDEPSAAGLAPPAPGWLLIADRGALYLAGFYIDGLGQLTVEYSEGYTGPMFSLNDDGELEVVC